LGGAAAAERDVEVPEKPARRRYSAAYKLRILEEADACSENSGELGALLRREGLYSSHLNTWRRQRREGTLAGLSPQKRGRKARGPDEQAQRVKELEQFNSVGEPTHGLLWGSEKTFKKIADFVPVQISIIAHQSVLEDGVAFIQKPFSLADMAEKVREILDSAPNKT